MKIKGSFIAATFIMVAATGWIYSGNVGESRTTGPAAAQGTTARAEEPIATVRVRAMTAVEHVSDLVIAGRTESVRQVDVKSETTGRVVAVSVVKGQRVKKGDVIARIAMDDRQARLAEAAALVDQRSIAFDAAQKLNEKNFRSAVTLAQNKADLEAAKAALERIQLDIERCTIRAPFAGVVDSLPAEQGFYATAGSVVAHIMDIDPMLVVAQISERNISGVKVGDLAVVSLVTGAEIGGTVHFVSRSANAATRTFRVEVEVDNADAAIDEGMTATLRLSLGRVMAHRMSPALLTLSDDGVLGVKAVDAEGIVRFYPAKLVSDTRDGVWLGELPKQLNVITVGQEFVRAGQAVKAVPESEIKG